MHGFKCDAKFATHIKTHTKSLKCATDSLIFLLLFCLLENVYSKDFKNMQGKNYFIYSQLVTPQVPISLPIPLW